MFRSGSKITPKFLNGFEGAILISPSCRLISQSLEEDLDDDATKNSVLDWLSCNFLHNIQSLICAARCRSVIC